MRNLYWSGPTINLQALKDQAHKLSQGEDAVPVTIHHHKADEECESYFHDIYSDVLLKLKGDNT